MVRLVGGVQVHHSHVVAGHLQDGHLVGDLGATVATSPPLPQELGSEHFARGLFCAALDHGKLSPVGQRADETQGAVRYGGGAPFVSQYSFKL